MKVIEYPPTVPPVEVRCRCGALLEYTESDCYFKEGIAGLRKYIDCPLCNHPIMIAFIPDPVYIRAGKKVFEFSDGSWAKEANP